VATAYDAGDPARATTAATDFTGQGHPIIAGSASSGVGLQVAPLAAENKVLFTSGPAATDGPTGINKYTLCSGQQSYQDIKTAASLLGDVRGKKVTVFAQDNAFAQASVASVIRGSAWPPAAAFGAGGATVTPLLVPATATDLVPFAKQAADADLLFVAWAGTNATRIWDSWNQQGAFDKSTVVTGLDITPTHAVLSPVAADLSLLAHYFDGATANDAEKALVAGLAKKNATPDLFCPDRFKAALMVAHAAESSPDDVDGIVTVLEGWEFDAPKGAMQIRAEDHALLQPMLQATLVDANGTLTLQLVNELTPDETAPPATPFN